MYVFHRSSLHFLCSSQLFVIDTHAAYRRGWQNKQIAMIFLSREHMQWYPRFPSIVIEAFLSWLLPLLGRGPHYQRRLERQGRANMTTINVSEWSALKLTLNAVGKQNNNRSWGLLHSWDQARSDTFSRAGITTPNHGVNMWQPARRLCYICSAGWHKRSVIMVYI